MRGNGNEDDEEEGNVAGDGVSDDSSEEPEEDEEEERRVREGFIVDEDEEDEEDEEVDLREKRRKHRKRRRRHHRRGEERDLDEELEEDDLDLLEENTGKSFSRNKLTRLRRGRDSASPPPDVSSKRRHVITSDDDLDDDLELPKAQAIQDIWDDEEDEDDFIEYDDEEDVAGGMDEAEREEMRRERRRREKERRKAMGSRPELTGIDANAWDEIYEVFGDGHDYDWALGDDEEDVHEDLPKETNYHDVFEPSEIRARHLTEDDDIIRAQDIPERMQLATSTLSHAATLSIQQALTEDDLDDAAPWVLTRLSKRKERDFFRADGQYFHLLQDLVSAITYSLRFLFVQEFEVPYIWTHKRDFISYFNPQESRVRIDLLSQDELWRVQALGQKYRSLLERRQALWSMHSRLGVTDEYFDEMQRKLETVEMVADATEWLSMKYKGGGPKSKTHFDLHFHDDVEEPAEQRKRKLPSRTSAYNVAKNSVVGKLAEGFGIKSHEIVMNFVTSETRHFVEDMDILPEPYADQFVDPDPTKAQSAAELLRKARMVIASELGKDPLLRQEIRNTFKMYARISVTPTERGISKIDEHHPYFAFKYLYRKPIMDLVESPQFLHILAAEEELLVTVAVTLPDDTKADLERRLSEAFASDSYSDTAKAWNAERRRVVSEALEQHLIPAGAKWAREWLREEVEDYMAWRCASTLRERIDVAPMKVRELEAGEAPSVLAMSWGKGDPTKDAITIVILDQGGRLREHTKIDNLNDQDSRDEFKDLLRRREPNTIAIGGFSVATTKLSIRVKELLRTGQLVPEGANDEEKINYEFSHIPVVYAQDEVARIYQHSKRAEDEFTSFAPIAKYCVGLARYLQSPLNEYAALGSDITAITFEEDHQPLIPQEKLLSALEHVLVDVVNKVGVDVNRAVGNAYLQRLLPFVAGLGPRKASLLVKKIASLGGNLQNREQFIKANLLTTKIFLNAAAFLRIPQENVGKSSKHRHIDESDAQDPLDDTRIHPEDYDLARKMASDALEVDEEDYQGEHPSYTVSLIMDDTDKSKKLDDLNLDEFAISLMESSGDRKRHTLNVIRAELNKPFAETRQPLQPPSDWEAVTMLTGETERTLRVGLIVSVLVQRIRQGFVNVRLDSGLEGIINAKYLADEQPASLDAVVKKGQTLPGVIIDVKLNLAEDSIYVELSSRPADVQGGDSQFRRVKHDDAWNHSQYERDKEMVARKKRAETDKTRRLIKHPNFHNFNSTQAEAFLDKQQRGDVVIRPSSKGFNHLAVTWKVDDKLYQHIDVVEPNPDPTGQTTGGMLIVDGKYEFSDLDELIVNHVQALARRVEELMMHEKFKAGPEDELHLSLKNFVAANPSKSMYGFTLNRKRPGHFNLCFLANKNSTVQTWPVRVAPEAYFLFDTPATGVSELCDAFKLRQMHESQTHGAGGTGSKTPYGGRTPARTPALGGMATPGHMSVRQPIGRTPNPYAGGATPAPNGGGFRQPPPPPNQFGFHPPGMPPAATPFVHGSSSLPPPSLPPSMMPPGMNPQRAQMIQQSGGWGTTPNRPW
ncbi:transcription elongation factor SPT6 [Vararia minispora EC-137]|uniref:Transcription elongation factor SPT6 n=1 Tax=Vararia minispora EC-137 TaxID=1314806 RepID=A0ACB8QVI4_9AGAM|nr:transcription elongation factor SPT6 [Vararia minispora EC-137]